MKKKVLISCMSMLALLCISPSKQISAMDETFDSQISPTFEVTRIYGRTTRFYGSYSEVKSTVYHEFRGFSGYIGLVDTISSPGGVTAYYAGYLYPPGSPLPMPTKKTSIKDIVEPFSNLLKKRVVVYRVFPNYLSIESRIPYDDGTFSGYIDATKAEQRPDEKWLVRFEGYVYNYPRETSLNTNNK